MSKTQRKKKENPKSTSAIKKDSVDARKKCQDSISRVNALLEERRKLKINTLENCDEKHENCNCGDESHGNPVGQKTDLIILVDTSGSMGHSASLIDNAVKKAIASAKKTCEPDLRLIFLGVDGTTPGTVFSQSHRDYIYGIHGTGTVLQADLNHVGYKPEQGANAIEDLSKFADWRDGACRAIFYISDEELDSWSPRNDFANETAATNAAITEANANDVTIFAHYITDQNLDPLIKQNYEDLCYNTGGELYSSNTPSEKEYIKLLTEVICNSCGKSVCKEIKLPEIKPCIEIKWGDSECDCLESSDYEVMTLTVCNCYKNIRFDNFIISMIEVVDENEKPVALLPNGTPSVKIHPVGVYCFGEIEPCSCVTREFVIINEGAKEGKYKLKLKGICFDISIPKRTEEECFEFVICKD